MGREIENTITSQDKNQLNKIQIPSKKDDRPKIDPSIMLIT